MRVHVLGPLVLAGLALLVAITGVAAADPGHHEVQIVNESGDVDASYYYDSSAGTVNVTEDGGNSWTNSTLSNPDDSAKAIEWALGNVSAVNDTVLVGPGTYNGTVSVTAPVLLEATEGPSQTTLNPATGGQGGVGFLVMRTGAVVRNFTVAGYSSPSSVAIDVDTDNVTVVDNVVKGNYVGIDDSSPVSGESSYLNNTVADNLVTGVKIGADQTTLRDNRVQNNSEYGIVLRDHSDSLVRDNDVRLNGRDGIHVNNSDNNTLESNTVIGNGRDYGDNGIEISNGSDWNFVADSNLESSYDVGVFVDGSSEPVVRNNTISNNGDGIEVTASSKAVTVVENWVSGPSDGKRIGVLAPDSSALNNTVIGGEGIVVEAQNATIAGNIARDNTFGIVVEGTDHTVTNNSVTGASELGIHLRNLANSSFAENNASRNEDGMVLAGVTNTTLTDTVVNDNQLRGITSGFWTGFNDSVFENVTAQRNGGAAFYAEWVDGPANVITGLDIGASTNAGTTIDLEAKNVSISSVGSSPGAPSGLDSIGRLVNVANTSAPADRVNLTLHYEDGDLDNFDDSTLALYNHSGGTRTEVGSATRDANNHTVSTTLTDYGVLGLYAESTSTSSGSGSSGGGGGYYPPPSDDTDDGSSDGTDDGNASDDGTASDDSPDDATDDSSDDTADDDSSNDTGGDSPNETDGDSSGDAGGDSTSDGTNTETGDDDTDGESTDDSDPDDEPPVNESGGASPNVEESGTGSFPWWLLLLLLVLAVVGGVAYYYREEIRVRIEDYREEIPAEFEQDRD